MAKLTKVSPYRSGAPRFGTKSHDDKWDPSVKEYKLTPEQLKRYLAGTPMEEIMKEEGEEMGRPRVIGYGKYEELLAENEKLKFELSNRAVVEQPVEHSNNEEVEKLQQEIKDAHVLVDELRDEMERAQTLFDEAMTAKGEAEHNNLVIQNQLNKVNDALKEKEYLYTELLEAYNQLFKELHPLRELAYLKLKQDMGEF